MKAFFLSWIILVACFINIDGKGRSPITPQFIRPAVTITPEVSILIDKSEARPIQKAAQNLVRDLEKVFGSQPRIVSSLKYISQGAPVIIIAHTGKSTKQFCDPNLTGFESHLITTRQVNNSDAVILQGSDMRGTIYAIYTFSEKILGVPPFWYFCGWEPKKQKQIKIPPDLDIRINSPDVKYRAWFPNDMDLLTPWRRLSQINDEIWLETALRLKLNTIEWLDAGKRKFDDKRSFDEKYTLSHTTRLIHEHGLIYTPHHHNPLNASFENWDDYWEKIRNTEPPELLLSNEAQLEEYWRYNIETVKKAGLEMIWVIGFRGAGDHPFWHTFSDAPQSMKARGEVISRMLKKQRNLVIEITGNRNAQFRTIFYDELSDLLADGYLHPPEDPNLIWNFVAARRDHYPNEDLQRLDPARAAKMNLGYYFNYQFTSTGSHLAPAEGPWKMEQNYRYVAQKRGKPVMFSVVNAGNIREHIMELAANAAMMWDFENYTSDQFLRDFCVQYYGDSLADPIASLYRDYYHAYWNPKKNNLAGFNRQYIFQDLRYRRAITQIVGAMDEPYNPDPLSDLSTERLPGRTFRIVPEDNDADNQIVAIINGTTVANDRFFQVKSATGELEQKLEGYRRVFFHNNLAARAAFMYHLNRALLCVAKAYGLESGFTRMTLVQHAMNAAKNAREALQRTEYGPFHSWYANSRIFNIDQLIRTLESRFHRERELVEAEPGMKLVDNFDHYTVTNLTRAVLRPVNGTLGGKWSVSPSGRRMWDARILVSDGTHILSINNQGRTSDGRTAMIYGLSNDIDDQESGILFFRFRIAEDLRTDAGTLAFAGIHNVSPPTIISPDDIIAGFGISGSSNAGELNIVTLVGQKILYQIQPGKWYNAWIDVNNKTDRFDVYIRVADTALTPQTTDRILKAEPLTGNTNKPLHGAVFMCPKASHETRKLHIDDIYWNGDQGLMLPDARAVPNSINWQVRPIAVKPTQVHMKAASSDSLFDVEYFFENLQESDHTSGWQSCSSWTDKGLMGNRKYSYRVKARYTHANQNETEWSELVSVKTPKEEDRHPPSPMTVLWNEKPVELGYNNVRMSAGKVFDMEGNTPVEYFFENMTDSIHSSGWQTNPVYIDQNLSFDCEYSYRVKARDASGYHNETDWSKIVKVKTGDKPAYQKYSRKSLIRHFPSLDMDVPIYVYLKDSSTGSKGAPLIVYVRNHGYPRIGQESDESIINDFLNHGYLVVTLNFMNNSEARSPRFDSDLYHVLWSVYGYRTESLLKGTGIRAHEDHFWIIPAGYRLDRGITYFDLEKHGSYGTKEHVLRMWNSKKNMPRLKSPDDMYNPDGSPLDWKLRMDVIYPSRPVRNLPVIIWAATQSTRKICSPATYRPHLFGFLMRGYVLAITDHCYSPLNRHWAYGHGFHPSYSLALWNGMKAESAAVRYLRKFSDRFGIDDKNIGMLGHSKGTYSVAVMANPNHHVSGEYRDFKGFPKGTPEPQPWQGYSSRIKVSYQSIGVWN